MAGRLQLEDFSQGGGKSWREAALSQDIERKIVASYEHGYKAGWDDATNAQRQERTRISADLARNIQNISFSYHEARTELLRSVEPLLREIVESVLPAAAAAGLPHTILDALRPLADGVTEAPVELVVNAANRAAVLPLLQSELSLPLTVVEEPSLGEGQAFIRLGHNEKSIDTEEVLATVTRAIDAYFSGVAEDEVADAG